MSYYYLLCSLYRLRLWIDFQCTQVLNIAIWEAEMKKNINNFLMTFDAVSLSHLVYIFLKSLAMKCSRMDYARTEAYIRVTITHYEFMIILCSRNSIEKKNEWILLKPIENQIKNSNSDVHFRLCFFCFFSAFIQHRNSIG